MKIDEKCFEWFQTAIYNGKDASSYYTEMRIADEKCQRGRNPHFCQLRDAMKNNMEIKQTELDRSLKHFKCNCVAHSKIEDCWEE